MSVTEDQSTAVVTALAWSPPGLAVHRRSVLAVLTSNHILSLWASRSDFSVPESWERVSIVNNFESSDNRSSPREQFQLRIRSMAWAPALTHIQTFSIDNWGPFFIAIGDDNNGIHLLSVRSPFIGHLSPWQVVKYAGLTLPTRDQLKTDGGAHGAGNEVRSQNSGSDLMNKSVARHRHSLFEKSMGLVCSVNKITSGPCMAVSGEAEILLTCRRSGLVTQVRLVLSQGSPMRATLNVQDTLDDALVESSQHAFDRVERPATWQIGSVSTVLSQYRYYLC